MFAPDDTTLLRILGGVFVAIIPGIGWLIKRSLQNDARLVKVETIIADLAEARKATADILPRLDETMRNLAEVCKQIVPRPEWELAQRLNEERMTRIEQTQND